MSYICYHNKNFILIDSSVRNGVFCRLFSSDGKTKSILLQSTPTVHYSANLFSEGNLEIITIAQGSQLYYYKYVGTQFQKSLLLTAENNTSLMHPFLYTQNQIGQFLYITQLSTSHYQLNHQILGEDTHQLVTTFNQPPLQPKYVVTPSGVYFFYVEKQDVYTLNCIKIEANQISTYCYLRSEAPLIDYSICIVHNEVHVCYVLEKDRTYNLYYLNSPSTQINFLASSHTSMAPVIFYYYHGLWINTFINEQLHLLLSMDLGTSFSIPLLCSIQSHLQRSVFINTSLKYLIASELYISLDHNIRLCILSTIDIQGLHRALPTELDLLLEGLSLNMCQKDNCELVVETNRLKQELNLLKQQQPISSPKAQTHIASATTAFMEELTGWDLPPRL